MSYDFVALWLLGWYAWVLWFVNISINVVFVGIFFIEKFSNYFYRALAEFLVGPVFMQTIKFSTWLPGQPYFMKILTSILINFSSISSKSFRYAYLAIFSILVHQMGESSPWQVLLPKFVSKAWIVKKLKKCIWWLTNLTKQLSRSLKQKNFNVVVEVCL